MYAPEHGDLTDKFEIFEEIRGERGPPYRFRSGLFLPNRAGETQEYARGRNDVERCR